MQQVGAKGFADAQLVDPRQLPVPLSDLSRKARVNFGYAWVLHRKIMLRAAAAGIALVAIVGAYEAREAITAGALSLTNFAQGEFARAAVSVLPPSATQAKPAWLPFLRVADLPAMLAQVPQLGGRVMVKPSHDVFDGRLAVIADPGGAALGVMEWDDETDEARKRRP